MKIKKLVAIICGGVCVAVLLCWIVAPSFDRGREIRIDPTKLYSVSSIVDGDTFKARIGSREITVRMLGIDTPETVDPRKPEQCFGYEASDETKALLVGHSVRLESNPNRERRDKYGRYLQYVYRDDDLFVNEFLLKEGFAREYTYGKQYSLQASFRKVEKEAKTAKKGLWGACSNKSV